MSGQIYSILQRPYGSIRDLRPAGSYQICYEHAFNTFHDHKEGSNEYVYKFPDHWIQYPGSLHAISLRSVNVHPAARDIVFRDICLRSNTEGSTLDVGLYTYFTLAYDEDMNKFNERMKSEIKDLYENYKNEVETSSSEWRPTDLRIFYSYATNELIFTILDDIHYFAFTNTLDTAKYMSDDFKSMIGINSDEILVQLAKYQNKKINLETLNIYLKSVPQFSVKFRGETLEVIEFRFKNVWNRGTLTVNSTLSTLAEQSFLALSNTLYPVPKYYEIKGFRTDFSIFLYDACLKKPVELPRDNKDLLTLEMILVAR